MEKKNLFIDMDGVLAEWREDQTAKDTYRKGYFENLRPYSNVVGAEDKSYLCIRTFLSIFCLRFTRTTTMRFRRKDVG